jgi:hypothetical protein
MGDSVSRFQNQGARKRGAAALARADAVTTRSLSSGL